MKKYFILLSIIVALFFVSCSSSHKNENLKTSKIIFQNENVSLNEIDYTCLIIKKESFSHQYIEDDDSIINLFAKRELQRNLNPYPLGKYEFTGTVMYEDSYWDIFLNYTNTLSEPLENQNRFICCENIEMQETTKTDCSNVFKKSDGNILYYHINENAFSKANCIIRPDGTTVAKINSKKNTFTYEDGLTEEEKKDVVKCIALYECYKHYVWNN